MKQKVAYLTPHILSHRDMEPSATPNTHTHDHAQSSGSHTSHGHDQFCEEERHVMYDASHTRVHSNVVRNHSHDNSHPTGAKSDEHKQHDRVRARPFVLPWPAKTLLL